MKKRRDYYSVLGVSPAADQDTINEAFRDLASKYHPAVTDARVRSDRMREIGEAWQVLSDRYQRARYDAARAAAARHRFHPFRGDQDEDLGARRIDRGTDGPTDARATLGKTLRWKSLLWLAVAIDLLLIASATLLNNLGQLFWIIGISIGACISIFCLARSLSLRSASLFGVSSFIAGAVIAAAGFMFFLRASSIPARTETEVLGPSIVNAASVATAVTPVPPSEPACASGCTEVQVGCAIKGKSGPNGENVYYLPADPDYSRYEVEPNSADRWFCNESEAQSNGWRPAAKIDAVVQAPADDFGIKAFDPIALYVCSETAYVHAGPGEEYPIVLVSAKHTAWQVQGKANDWYFIGPTADGKESFLHQSALCLDPKWGEKPAQVLIAHPTSVKVKTLVPTATPVPEIPVMYEAPRLLKPSNGSSYTCGSELRLEWMLGSGVPLREDEWFVVEGRSANSEAWSGLADWTQDTSIILHPLKSNGECDVLWWPSYGPYQWRVRVVQGDRAMHAIKQFVSPTSSPFLILYSR